jgi:hypothetical protein
MDIEPTRLAATAVTQRAVSAQEADPTAAVTGIRFTADTLAVAVTAAGIEQTDPA